MARPAWAAGAETGGCVGHATDQQLRESIEQSAQGGAIDHCALARVVALLEEYLRRLAPKLLSRRPAAAHRGTADDAVQTVWLALLDDDAAPLLGMADSPVPVRHQLARRLDDLLRNWQRPAATVLRPGAEHDAADGHTGARVEAPAWEAAAAEELLQDLEVPPVGLVFPDLDFHEQCLAGGVWRDYWIRGRSLDEIAERQRLPRDEVAEALGRAHRAAEHAAGRTLPRRRRER